MSTIATLKDTGKMLGTTAKFIRLLGDLGVTEEQFTNPINDRGARRNLAAYLKAGCPDIPAPDTRKCYEAAVEILGDNFIPPTEIAHALTIEYSHLQCLRFTQSVPNIKTLEWLRDNDFALVAGPPQPETLVGLGIRYPRFFKKEKGSWDIRWKSNLRERFAYTEEVAPHWFKIRKHVIPGSIHTSAKETLVPGNEALLNVAQIVWCLIAYKAAGGVFLLPGTCTITTSFCSDNTSVLVGCESGDKGGIVIASGTQKRIVTAGIISRLK